MRLTFFVASLLGLLNATTALASGNAYFRFPTLHQDTLVFTAEGDLWKTTLQDAQVQRLTSHAAEESRAVLSPDGQWLAFAANYEGPTELYLMPVTGGLPKRISFENSPTLPLGWTAQGEVLFSTQYESGPDNMRIVGTINPQTLARRVFPLADARDAVVDTAGEFIYFTRFGLASSGDNARFYRGGAISQLWRYHITGTGEAERIGPLDANLRRPMFWQNQLYVLSDADGRDNLWQLATDGSAPAQLTHFSDYDIRYAQLDNGRIVYQYGADIHLLALADKSERTLDIQLPSDFEKQRPYWLEKPLRFLTSSQFSATGKQVAITARGRVSLAGLGPQRRVDISTPLGSRCEAAILSPDGAWLYAICDTSGEPEIWQFPADGSEGGKALTHDGSTQRWQLIPSPDGKYLAHSDKLGRLWLLDIKTASNQLIDNANIAGVEQYESLSWSADSRALAFVRPNSTRLLNQIGLYSLDAKRTEWLSNDKYPARSPVFSLDGKWLWFLADRHFVAPESGPWGDDRKLGPTFNRRSKVYALALQTGLRFPFQAVDELINDKAPESSSSASLKPPLQLTGISERLYEVPLAAADYRNLATDGERLYLLEGESKDKAELKTLAINNKAPQPEVFASEVAEFSVAADGKKLFYRKAGDGKEMFIVEAGAKAPSDLTKATVRLGDWKLLIDPRQEWHAMFNNAWRMQRDFLFDKQLRGVDWPAKRTLYTPLLERVGNRAELDDVLAQMVGELGTLHSQIRLGDMPQPDTSGIADLGALLQPSSQGWQISHIYQTDADFPNERGPLQAPGLDIKEGDVITALNGRNLANFTDIHALLHGQAGQQVLLTLQRGVAPSRKVIVTPADYNHLASLRYTDWELQALKKVQQAGKGQLGYIHLRAMSEVDMATFVREFYAQYQREGLIIDVRRNRGGHIDGWILEKLLRRTWAYWAKPHGVVDTNMSQSFRGHLVVLTDALTYSDGETFAAGIQALHLGPVIGSRTAGAGVWLNDDNPLVDKGMARVAEWPQFEQTGAWMIEGKGVTPDIEVENPPHKTYLGEDNQLNAAIAWLQDKLSKEPIAPLVPAKIPALPAGAVKP
jgi:tricorn protease